MEKNAYRWLGRSLVAVTVALAGACATDAPVATPTGRGVASTADITDGSSGF